MQIKKVKLLLFMNVYNCKETSLNITCKNYDFKFLGQPSSILTNLNYLSFFILFKYLWLTTTTKSILFEIYQLLEIDKCILVFKSSECLSVCLLDFSVNFSVCPAAGLNFFLCLKLTKPFPITVCVWRFNIQAN